MKFGYFFGLIKPKPHFAILPVANGNWLLVDRISGVNCEYKTVKQAEKAIDNLKCPVKYVN